MTKGRRALLAGGIVLLLLVVGAGLLVAFFPTDRIGRMVTAQAEEALDREVRIADFGLRLLPRPAVALEGVEVSRHARPGTTDGLATEDFEPLLASVGRVDLRPQILPLLRGDVVIDEIVVAAPTVLLEIAEGGELDLPEFEGEDEPDDTDARIEVRSVVVRDGRLVYDDRNTGVRVEVTGLEHRLGVDAEVAAGELTRLGLEGTLSVAAVEAELPDVLDEPLRDVSFTLDHDAELRPVEDRLDLRRSDLVLQEFPLGVSGTVDALSDPDTRTVDLEVRSHDVDVARLVASLPPELLEDLPRGPEGQAFTGTAGRVSLEADVSGGVGEESLPDVAGDVAFDDVALGYAGGAGDLVEALTGRVAFTLDDAATESLSGRLLGEPFSLAFDVVGLPEPSGWATVEGELDLGEAVRMGFAPEGGDASGSVAVDLRAEGPFTAPDRLDVDGAAQLVGVVLELPDLLQPVAVDDSRIEVGGGAITARDLGVTAGSSDAVVDADVRDWTAFLDPDAPIGPEVTFGLTSTLLDLDELMEADPARPTYAQLALAHIGDEPIDGRSAVEHAEEQGLELPDLGNLRLDGGVRIDRVIVGELEYERVEAVVTAAEGDLSVPDATFSVFGGEVWMQAALDRGPGEGAPRPLEAEYRVADVTSDPFLEEFTLFEGQVGGRLLLTGTVRMELRPDMLPEPERVSGEGTIAILDGELRNWPVVRSLGDRMGISEVADLDRLAFRDWNGSYRIEDSRIVIEESAFEHSDLMATLGGSFGIGGDLDVDATLLLPGEWAEGIPGAPSAFVAALTSGPDGRVPVGASVGGTTSSPDVSLDLSEAGARAAAQAREEAEGALREGSRRLIDELGLDLDLPSGEEDDEEEGEEDEEDLREEVEDEVRDRLRRFLP